MPKTKLMYDVLDDEDVYYELEELLKDADNGAFNEGEKVDVYKYVETRVIHAGKSTLVKE